MNAASIVLAAAWSLVAVQAVSAMRGGGALVAGCAALGLAALSGADALAGLSMAALVCLGAACALFALCFAPRMLSNSIVVWSIGVLVAACGAYSIIGGMAPLIALLCIFPLAFDAASTFAWRRLHQREAPPLFQLGLDAKLGALSTNAAYWLMSAHCGLIAVVASEVHRGAAAMNGQTSHALSALTRAAIYTPQIALVMLVLVSWKVAGALRAFAQASVNPVDHEASEIG